jgi:predicted anti-sigma-YlaC factor YlaD
VQQPDTVPYVAHDEFRSGLPAGRFRVVVDPQRARRYLMRRMRVDGLTLLLVGVGAALALWGLRWSGALLVMLGIVARRLVGHQAPRLLLHLATQDARVYDEVTSEGVMEVRRQT